MEKVEPALEDTGLRVPCREVEVWHHEDNNEEVVDQSRAHLQLKSPQDLEKPVP